MPMENSSSKVFVLIADLAAALGVKDIKNLPGCWEYQINKQWYIAVNGHKEKMKTGKGIVVLPFECYVEFNGWPAGMFSPFAGVICAGELANEGTFIEAVEKATKEINNDRRNQNEQRRD